jgi:Asp/Glu/hydantoin racemase
MSQTLALIHTSQVFLTVETMMKSLFAEIMPEVRLINIMDDSLLPQCMAAKEITPAVARRMCVYVEAAETAGADAVLSLCSSLGPTIDLARKLVQIPVIKIDDAHTEKAAREARRIGVMATVATTLQPTVLLIQEKAAALHKEVEIHPSLSNAAFEALMRGDKDRHDAMVLDAARQLAPNVDLILFAQASMTRLAPLVSQATDRTVLTSPRLAIEYTKRVLLHLKQNSENSVSVA